MSEVYSEVFSVKDMCLECQFRFLEMRIEVLDGTVSLLTPWILFLLVAIGSYDRIGMWSSKTSLVAHERFKKLV